MHLNPHLDNLLHLSSYALIELHPFEPYLTRFHEQADAVPDDPAKGFGISASLDAAAAEGANHAPQPPQTNTHIAATALYTDDYSHTEICHHEHQPIILVRFYRQAR